MDQVKFVVGSLQKIQGDLICLNRLYYFKFFKGGIPQILLGPFLNILSQILIWSLKNLINYISHGLSGKSKISDEDAAIIKPICSSNKGTKIESFIPFGVGKNRS